MGKTYIIGNFHRTDLVICIYLRDEKTPSYSQINTVGLSKTEEQSDQRLNRLPVHF